MIVVVAFVASSLSASFAAFDDGVVAVVPASAAADVSALQTPVCVPLGRPHTHSQNLVLNWLTAAPDWSRKRA